jgi:hypothetical protein
VPFLPEALRDHSSRDADPFGYLRGVLFFLFGGGIVVALVLAATGMSPRALVLAGALWAIFGAFSGLLDGVVEPLIDFLARALPSVGLFRDVPKFAMEESLLAQGHADAAAEAYRQHAENPKLRARALALRAEVLAGPLKQPALAVAELEALQSDALRLTPLDDYLVGMTLANLYETALYDRGKAMGELRRLLDRYPDMRQARFLRIRLANLRDDHFGTPPT